MSRPSKWLGLFLLSLSVPVYAANETPPDLQTMWKMLQQQQAEIQSLKAENKRLSEKVDMAGDMAEEAINARPEVQHATTHDASEPVDSPVRKTHGANMQKTSIGGYGELHYNNLDSKKEADLHRFVLFFGHEFSDKIRFFSELEVEHAISGGDNDGEVSMEQAYIEMDINDSMSAQAGILLMPFGIINETHEPPTFYGVERNPINKHIIPTTWREAGVGINGNMAPGWSYDLIVTTGLDVDSTYNIRGGRQKASNADATELAYTGRVKWTAIPGLELGLSAQYQEDITQGKDTSAGSATLLETHAVWQRGPIGLRALYARWDLDGNGPEAIGREEQYGWYVEPSYRINTNWGVFTRYNEWDNNAGSANLTDTKVEQWDIGLNYWPHEDVVLKVDYQNQSGAKDDDGFNLGIGYQF